MGAAALLAHQGGWDELLLIAGPMLVVVALLRLAKRRVDRNLPAAPDQTPSAADRAAASDESRRR